MIVVVYTVFVFIILAVLYIMLMVYDAKHGVGKSPRTDMFTCDKHGAIPSKYVHQLSGVTEKPVPYCPFCMEDKFKAVRQKGNVA